MKNMLKSFLSIAILMGGFSGSMMASGSNSTSGSGSTSSTRGHTFLAQRPLGTSNLTLWQAECSQDYNPCGMCGLNGVFYLVVGGGQSFDRDDTAQYFFFNGKDTMRFADPEASGNSSSNVDVYTLNFLLNTAQFTGLTQTDPGFDATIQARPRVSNVLAELGAYIGLDRWVQGLYLTLRLPINWQRTNMNIAKGETSKTPGVAIGQFLVGNATAVASPYTSIVQAWNGQLTTPFGDIKSPLQYARINGSKSKTGVSDLQVELGYNIWCTDCSHFGVNVHFIAPTGNKPKARYVFEPIAGNGGLWGAGGGISFGYQLWNNGCDQAFSLYFDGYARHLFKARQRRTFPLVSVATPAVTTGSGSSVTANPGSQYLLIKEFNPTTGLYAGTMDYGPNILTRKCKVAVGVEGEASLMFEYTRCGFIFDLGFDVWGRSHEKITNIDPLAANTYALAGDTGGTGSATANRTASQATINNPGLPTQDATNVYLTTASLNASTSGAASPGCVTYMPFLYVAYTWEACDWMPFIGVGGQVEFSGSHNKALKQWFVAAKGGFSFS